MRNELLQLALTALDKLTDKVDGTGFSDSDEFANALDVMSFIKQELAKPEPEPVGHQFQSRDGNWCNFLNEQHYENTVADGSWPVRAIYAEQLYTRGN